MIESKPGTFSLYSGIVTAMLVNGPPFEATGCAEGGGRIEAAGIQSVPEPCARVPLAGLGVPGLALDRRHRTQRDQALRNPTPLVPARASWRRGQ